MFFVPKSPYPGDKSLFLGWQWQRCDSWSHSTSYQIFGLQYYIIFLLYISIIDGDHSRVCSPLFAYMVAYTYANGRRQ